MPAIRAVSCLGLTLLVACSATPKTTSSCPSGQTSCAGVCVDLQTDNEDCGICGTACAAGQVCSAGACHESCATGYSACGADGGAYCANLETDNANCGVCGKNCATGQACVSGTCQQSCASGTMACTTDGGGGYCANVDTDNANCGQCGHTCPSGQVCSGGSCQETCASGYSACTPVEGSPFCANLQTDSSNCGTCGHACDALETCVTGACQPACGESGSRCVVDGGAPYCANLQKDLTDCGMCGRACSSIEVCVQGNCQADCAATQARCEPDGGAPYCADLQIDLNNCGMCGHVCAPGQQCTGGGCATSCLATEMLCSNGCTDVMTDPNNCGMCGHSCSNGQVCLMGTCGVPPCDPTATPFGGGQGTAGNPFLICSVAQLQAVSGTNGDSFLLAADLDLTGQTVELTLPSGTFDGAGHVLHHFYTTGHGMDGGVAYDFGLFDHLGSYPGTFMGGPPPAEVKNVNLEIDGVNAAYTYNVGGLVGHLGPGGSIDGINVTINDGGTIVGAGSVGALVGFSDSDGTITMTNSSVNGPGRVTCDGTDSNATIGGALGTIQFGTLVSNIAVNGLTVSCATASAGGLAGSIGGTANGLSVSQSSVSGLQQVGGIASNLGGATAGVYVGDTQVTSTGNQNVGQNGCGGVTAGINQSLVNVTVSNVQVNCPAAANVGGVTGGIWPPFGLVDRATITGTSVTGCNATAGVAGSLNNGVVTNSTIDAASAVSLAPSCAGGGGVVGWFVGGTILQCGSSANLTAGANDQWLGGIAGYVQLTSPMPISATVSQCYTHGTVTADSSVGSVGGLVGAVFGSDPSRTLFITYSYSDQDLSAVAGAPVGGLLGSANLTLTGESPGNFVSNQAVFYGKAPMGDCTLGAAGGTFDITDMFWLSATCTGGNPGTGITAMQAATQSFFEAAGFTFPSDGYGSVWQMGPTHPILGWEPSSL